MELEELSADVDTQFLCVCKFEDDCIGISIRKSMSIIDIYERLMGKCPQINPMLITVKYLLPEHEIYVALIDDHDVANMCHVYSCDRKGVILMEATRKNHGLQRIMTSAQLDARSGTGECSSVAVKRRTISLESMRDCINGEGQVFENADEFRTTILNYSVAHYRNYKLRKNDSEKVFAVCVNKDCEWKIYAARGKRDGLFSIRRCNLEHTCNTGLGIRGHPRAKSNWVANIVKGKLRHTPSYAPIDIMNSIHDDYGVQLRYHHAWRGKEMAMQEIHGKTMCSYNQLQSYCRNLKLANPGSIAEYEVEEDSRKFRRLFVCFRACIVGFVKGCRPLLFLDGTFLKSKYRGCLLSSTGLDANNGLFPVAFAVVNAENNDNWEWFCRHLASALSHYNGGVWNRYTFFSDRHSGLLRSVPMCFPGSHHAYCLRHLVDNYKKEVLTKYPGLNKKNWTTVFKRAAYGLTIDVFNDVINQIVDIMPQARSWLVESNPQNWANSLFPGHRWGILNNNPAESFNSWIRAARNMPITAMVDNIRVQMMTQTCKRRSEELVGATELCAEPEKRLRLAYKGSRHCKLHQSSPTRFEAVDRDMTYDVDLEARTCSCRGWQVNGIPCKHGCAIIEDRGMKLYNYCDAYYSVDMFKLSYNEIINPIPNATRQEAAHCVIDIRAPDVHVQPGRRKTKRIPSQVESRPLKCSQCKKFGHNKRTCKNGVTIGVRR